MASSSRKRLSRRQGPRASSVVVAGIRAVVVFVLSALVPGIDLVELLCFGGFSFVSDADDGEDDQSDNDDDAEQRHVHGGSWVGCDHGCSFGVWFMRRRGGGWRASRRRLRLRRRR